MEKSVEPFYITPASDFLKRHPELRRDAFELEEGYASGEQVTGGKLEEIGTALWQLLGLDEALEEALQQAGGQALPLVINSGSAEIQHLPWEALYQHEYGFLSRSNRFILSRSLNGNAIKAPPLEAGPLRVLLFTAMPDDHSSRLDVEEEQARVQEALLPQVAEGRIKLEMPEDGCFSTLQQLVFDFRPHVLFLSGHGKFHHQLHSGEEPYGIFFFEDENGQGHEVRDKEIAATLTGSSVQCAVLSACESGKAASVSLTGGLLRQLAQVIPHVIGMRESLLDQAGILLARSFCDVVAQEERIDAALQQARLAISQAADPGQWCLPMLFSNDPALPLIDWNFTAQPPEMQASLGFGDLTLPSRFIGRRSELRKIRNRLRQNDSGRLLLTGPGGQGKTALIGKLTHDFERQRYTSLVFQAGQNEEETENRLTFLLVQANELLGKDESDKQRTERNDDQKNLEVLLGKLIQKTGNKLLLVFDNLESIQDEQSLELNNEAVRNWLSAARKFAGNGLILLLTSRWRLPDWPDADHWPLAHAIYGDFLAMARQLNLSPAFYANRDRLHPVYEVLHGNGRGLEFFARAIEQMDVGREEDFLAALRQAEEEIQVNMCLEQIISHLSPEEKTLLERLPVYPVPVPMQGLIKLGADLMRPERLVQRLIGLFSSSGSKQLIQRLLDLSLLEQRRNPELQMMEYKCPALVSGWLEQEVGLPDVSWYSLAADYLLYFFKQGAYRNLNHAIVCHNTLRVAQRKEEADRFAIDHIIDPLSRAGKYIVLLDEWLPDICRSRSKWIRAVAVNQVGKQHYHLGDLDDALFYFERSYDIFAEINSSNGKGTVLNNKAQIYQDKGDYKEAISCLDQALKLQRSINNKSGVGNILNNLSQVYHDKGDYDTAQSYLEEALKIHQEQGDKYGEGAVRIHHSRIYHAEGDLDAEHSYLKQALKLLRKSSDRAGEGRVLNTIASNYYSKGDYDTALHYFHQALKIQETVGDKFGKARTLNNISLLHGDKGNYDTALAQLQQALEIQREIGDKSGKGTTLNNLSQLYHNKGNYDKAHSYLKEALKIHQETGDKHEEAATLHNISRIYNVRGDLKEEHTWLKKSLEIQREIGNKSGEGTSLNNISLIYHAQGDYEKALKHIQQSLEIHRKIGDKSGEGVALHTMSVIHHSIGDLDTAESCLRQSLNIQREIGDKFGIGTTLHNISRIYSDRGDLNTASSYLEQALAIQREIGDRYGEGRTLHSISKVYDDKGDHATALQYLEDSQKVQRKIGNKSSGPTQAGPSPEVETTEQDSKHTAPKKYDVFLCHNSGDKPAVKEIARHLQQHGIVPWLDEWEVYPGTRWQRVLEEQIATIRSAAVFIGPNGIGPWQDVEQKAFLQQFQSRNSPIIPVILSGPSGHITTPAFLNLFQRVDFRKTEPDPMMQLIWGITGKKTK